MKHRLLEEGWLALISGATRASAPWLLNRSVLGDSARYKSDVLVRPHEGTHPFRVSLELVLQCALRRLSTSEWCGV